MTVKFGPVSKPENPILPNIFAVVQITDVGSGSSLASMVFDS